jgi:hypothetical protein
MTPFPVPSASEFDLGQVMAQAVSLINDVAPVWLFIIGAALGVAVLAVIINYLKEALP